jgi:hypothetical protein
MSSTTCPTHLNFDFIILNLWRQVQIMKPLRSHEFYYMPSPSQSTSCCSGPECSHFLFPNNPIYVLPVGRDTHRKQKEKKNRILCFNLYILRQETYSKKILYFPNDLKSSCRSSKLLWNMRFPYQYFVSISSLPLNFSQWISDEEHKSFTQFTLLRSQVSHFVSILNMFNFHYF